MYKIILSVHIACSNRSVDQDIMKNLWNIVHHFILSVVDRDRQRQRQIQKHRQRQREIEQE